MPEHATRHLGWSFSGLPRFEGRAATFLAGGLQRNERLFFVADDPDPALWPDELLLRDILQVASTSEIYGPDATVDAASLRHTFEGVLKEALDDGYAGIRVAADNTSLMADADRFPAWLRWEVEVDQFIAENPVTGLCAFDRRRVTPEMLHRVLDLHAYPGGAEPGLSGESA